jgi:hypothetical protein
MNRNVGQAVPATRLVMVIVASTGVSPGAFVAASKSILSPDSAWKAFAATAAASATLVGAISGATGWAESHPEMASKTPVTHAIIDTNRVI